jgi:hypothetical protein
MATSVVLPREENQNPFASVVRFVPGVLLLAAIGFAGKVLEQSINGYAKAHHLVIPNIEYVLWAIAIGLLIANTVTIPNVFFPGIATYEFWLKAGIVLLGARFVVGDVLKLGGISIALVVLEISGSLFLMTMLGRLFNLKPILTFIAETREYISGELRNGDRPDGKPIARHLAEVFAALPGCVRDIYARADSGFYCGDAVQAYEKAKAEFIMVARKTSRLVEQLQSADWKPSFKTDADQQCEFWYQPEGWGKAYRFIALRYHPPGT